MQHPASIMNETNSQLGRKRLAPHRTRPKHQEPTRTGAWLAEEDDRLRDAVKMFGNRWSSASVHVKTRSGDQCAKRWNENLKPGLDHSPWEPQEDDRLLGLTETYGRNWKFIADNYLKTRAALALKNRYSLLERRQRRLESDQVDDDARLESGEAQPEGTLSSSSGSSSPMTQDSTKDNLDHRAKLVYAASDQEAYKIPSSATSNCSALDMTYQMDDRMICDPAIPAWDHISSFWQDYTDVMGIEGAILSVGDSMPDLVDTEIAERPVPGSMQQVVWPGESFSPEIGEHAGDSDFDATEVEYSVTCQRSKLKAAVNRLMDAAMSDRAAGIAQSRHVTVKLSVRN